MRRTLSKQRYIKKTRRNIRGGAARTKRKNKKKEQYQEYIEEYIQKIQGFKDSNPDTPKANAEIRERLYSELGSLGDNNKELRQRSKALKKALHIAFNTSEDTGYQYYPETFDTEFQTVITNKKEFNENRNKGLVDRCSNKQFQLTPHQQFLSNYISPKSIYKSVLLFHGTGTGKTCTAISIAENFKKQVKKYNRIMVICSKSVTQNFYNNIFNESSLTTKTVDNQCTGRTYYDMIDTSVKVTSKSRYRAIKKKIKDIYDITTYFKFAKIIAVEKERDKSDRKIEYKKFIHDNYSNRLLLIDEVQALRDESSRDKYNKLIPEILMDIAKHTNNTRFVLLSATPMFNDPNEILWLINLMRVNDNKPAIPDDFFSEGKLVSEKTDEFKELTKGYVSYVRGEDPINFPLRLYPHRDGGAPDDLIMTEAPSLDFFDRAVNDPNFEKLQLYCPEAQGVQYDKLKEAQDKLKDNKALTLSQVGKLKNMSLIVYPGDGETLDDLFKENEKKDRGLFDDKIKKRKQFSYKNKDDPFLKWDPEGNKPLEDYSIKFAKTIESIDRFIKSGNKGIIFVYSEPVKEGIIPFCLALEQYGFANYNGVELLDKTGIDSTKIDYNGQRQEAGRSFHQAKYIMVTGSSNNPDNEINISKQPENIDGRHIRVIVGSDVMSEGIDLKWVREVHVLHPWFHLNKIEQIIGRGIRFCSHAHPDFPEEERNVTVFLHSIAEIEGRDSADIHLYRESWRKAIEIGKIERALKESSVDCNIHKDANTVKSPIKLPVKTAVSGPQDAATTEELNWQQPIADDPINLFSKICSYSDNCDYKCMATTKSDTNKDTYKISHSKHRIRDIKNLVKEYYAEKVCADFKTLLEMSSQFLNLPGTDIKELVSHALNEIVEKNVKIVNRGRQGKVIQKNKWYIFIKTNRGNDPMHYQKYPLTRRTNRKSLNTYKPDKKKISPETIKQLQLDEDILKKEDSVQEFVKEHNINPELQNEYFLNRLSYDKLLLYLPYIYTEYHKDTGQKGEFKRDYKYFENHFIIEGDKVYFLIFNDDNKPQLFVIKNKESKKISSRTKEFSKLIEKYLLQVGDTNVSDSIFIYFDNKSGKLRIFKYVGDKVKRFDFKVKLVKDVIDSLDSKYIFGNNLLEDKKVSKLYTEFLFRNVTKMERDKKLILSNLEYGIYLERNPQIKK